MSNLAASTPSTIPHAAGSPPLPQIPVTHPADSRWAVSAGAVIAWLAVHLGCLLLGLLQVPLAAGYPSGSTLLPELLIAGQIGFSGFLTPMFRRSAATTAVVTAVTFPAILLAGGLAARPMQASLLAAAVVTAWLLSLYFWSACFRKAALWQLLSAVATLIAVGAALLAYLVTEFAPGGTAAQDASTGVTDVLSQTPLLLSWRYAGGADIAWYESLPLALVLLVGAANWLSRRCYARSFNH